MPLDLQPTPPPDWDDYVSRHPAGSAYHRASAVQIGQNAFGLRVAFLISRDAGSNVRGVLPLVEQSSVFFGRFLVSVPFFTYGGILADDASAADDLSRGAAELGRERRAAHVELRHHVVPPGIVLPERLDKVSMVLNLPSNEDLLAKALGSKLRSQIKRGGRDSPEVVWGGSELIGEFYRVFAETMHRLGTPVYPKSFFAHVCRALDGLMSVVVIRVRGEAQAAAIIVRHGSSIEVPWAAAGEAAKANSVNMRMYWEVLVEAIRRGASTFDFGRSSLGSGTYRFKQQWGAKPVQLHWHYWLSAKAALPQLNHSNPKYAVAASLWRRMPLWCANLIGPRIARNLP